MSAGNRVEATNADKATPDPPITTYLDILGERQHVSMAPTIHSGWSGGYSLA
jgi:hypothetical protein